MLWVLVALALTGDPLPGAVHKPGVDGVECSEGRDKGRVFWSCVAACWRREDAKGKPKADGGTFGYIIRSEGASRQAAEDELQRQYRNGCKP